MNYESKKTINKFIKFSTALKAILIFSFFYIPNMVLAQDGVTGLNTANTTLKTYISPITTIVLVIGGIIGIVGAIQVYSAFNNGDPDATKKLMGWGGACLFLVLSSVLVKAFFGL